MLFIDRLKTDQVIREVINETVKCAGKGAKFNVKGYILHRKKG